MANIVWSGAASGDINATGNWVGGAVPTLSDVAVFNQGSVDADTNVTAPTNAVWLGLVVTPGYTGNIGGSGNALTVSFSGAGYRVEHYGAGQLWLKDSSGTTTGVYIATASANTIVDLGGNTMTDVTILRGMVTLAGDMGAITKLAIGQVNSVNDATVVLTAGMSAVTKAIIAAGTVTVNSTITTLNMAGGRLTIPVSSAGTLTTAEQTGGTIVHNGTSTVGTLLTTGGTFDLGTAAKTVTTADHVGNLIANEGIHTLTTEFDRRHMMVTA